MFSDSSNPSAKDSALQPSEQQRLSEAEHLFEDGKPGQAAPLFAKLAEVLTSANQPKRAATVHAQAAQAFAQSRNESAALTQARAALNLFLQYHMEQAALFYYNSISRELNNRGMKNAAQALTNDFGYKVGSHSTPVIPKAGQSAHFPPNCPQCGAPVRSDEVHWIDVSTVECAFCGTPIQTSA